jgi:hypothetical protein
MTLTLTKRGEPDQDPECGYLRQINAVTEQYSTGEVSLTQTKEYDEQ